MNDIQVCLLHMMILLTVSNQVIFRHFGVPSAVSLNLTEEHFTCCSDAVQRNHIKPYS